MDERNHEGACLPTHGLRPAADGGLSAARDASAPATIGRLVEALEAVFPPENAEPWDRTGLLVGDASAPLRRVATALDPTPDAIARAEACGANVLVTHHPVFLDPPPFIGPRASGVSASGAAVYEAVCRGVALANFHTAFDVSMLAQAVLPGLLSLTRIGVLDPLAHDERLGYGQVCVTNESMTLEDLALRCAEVFGRAPRVWGDFRAPVSTAATWTGSAGPAPELCLAQGIDVLVCGEVKYHAALDAAGGGLAIVELGHDVSELPFAAVLAQACVEAGVPCSSVTCLEQQDNWNHPESRRQ